MRTLRKRFRKFLARAAWPARTSFRPIGTPADPVLEALVQRRAITDPVILIAAHPDDETIGIGGRLGLFKNLSLIHVTDGAPDERSAKRRGFPDAASYSTARFAELEKALGILDVRPARQRAIGLVDGRTLRSLRLLIEIVTEELQNHSIVITHPYEGGHIDHDSCAFAVQMACDELQATGTAPIRMEFAGYHSDKGRQRSGRFYDSGETSVAHVRLTADERRRKTEAFAAFGTQSGVLSMFRKDRETYRSAPRYDFTLPPPPGAWLYDRFGGQTKGVDWLNAAREVIAERQRQLID